MSGTAIAAEVVAGLEAEGLANRFTLLVPASPSSNPAQPWKQTSGTPTEVVMVCRPMTNGKGYTQKTGASIEDCARVFTVYNTKGVKPSISHQAKLYDSSDLWQVVRVDPNDFDEEPVSWMVKVKR